MSAVQQASIVTIRDARPEDAVAACEVLRASITQLCKPDHNDSPMTLSDWLKNKTPIHVRLWICSPANHIYLARLDDMAAGVGGFSNAGELTLLYVAPEARFQGVSKGLLHHIESKAKAMGMQELTLISTTTARDFYLKHGYHLNGEPVSGFGAAPSYPMRKRLK